MKKAQGFIRVIRFYLILLIRFFRIFLLRKSLNFEVIATPRIVFRKSFLILKFNCTGVLYITSHPGYRSVDLDSMYLDISKFNSKEIRVIAHGIFEVREILIQIDSVLDFTTRNLKETNRYGLLRSDSRTIIINRKKLNLEYLAERENNYVWNSRIINLRPTFNKPTTTTRKIGFIKWSDLN